MFATVECKDAQSGVKTFFRDLFSFPEIMFYRVHAPDGDYFYRVVATEYRGQVPLDEISEKLNKLKGSVLFDINIPCDESTGCLEFHPSRLPALLLFNSFTDYIHNLSLPPLKSSLTVFDSDGVYADIIQRAVSLFSKIEVYTKKRSLYESISRKLMDEYGISLLVSDSFSGKAPKSTVILSPGEIPFCDFFGGIIFSLCDTFPPCNCALKGEGIDLPCEYELLRPGGIDKMSFASALYEKCNVQKLGALCCKKLQIIN